MNRLVYDGSFEGWLCSVFEVYNRRLMDASIVRGDQGGSTLFASAIEIAADEEKATRVWTGLCRRISNNAAKQLYRAFLSEQPGVEDQLLAYARYALASNRSIEFDYSHPAVRYVIDMDKKVRREKHRMEAFVRFALGGDGIYAATVSPDFNVLPLIRRHFEQRYADQRWLIYDVTRKYGIYYDLQQTLPVTIGAEAQGELANSRVGSLDIDELNYQDLWRHYFQKVNIAARKNTKLHLRHMPSRYWKFLPEKRPI